MSANDLFEYIFKIVVLGKSKTGKTKLLKNYVGEEGTIDSITPTIGVEFFTKKVLVDNHTVLLQFWDISGRSQFRSIVDILLKGASAAILMFNKRDLSSLKEIREIWLPLLRNNLPNIIHSNDPLILVIAKLDHTPKKRSISKNEIKKTFKAINFLYYEIYDKEKEKFHAAIEQLVRNIIYYKKRKIIEAAWSYSYYGSS